MYALYLLVARLVLRRDGRARARRNAERIVALRESVSGWTSSPPCSGRCFATPRLVHGLNARLRPLQRDAHGRAGSSLLFRRRDEGYHRFRRTCLLAHLGAQPVFFLLPTAPPRVLDGFVDTLSEVSGLDLEHPLLVRFYNPVAAMPSLHVAFAVVTGAEIAARSRLA